MSSHQIGDLIWDMHHKSLGVVVKTDCIGNERFTYKVLVFNLDSAFFFTHEMISDGKEYLSLRLKRT